MRSGKPEESCVTYGVICTKTVIHNKMKTSIHSPKIMLLQSSVAYQRVTNKLTSLDPQILQVMSHFVSGHEALLRILVVFLHTAHELT